MSLRETTRFELIKEATSVAGGGALCDVPEAAGAERVEEPDETRLRSLIDSVQAGVLMEDGRSRIVLANQAFCDLLRLEEGPEALRGWEAGMVFAALGERFSDPEGVLRRTAERVAGRRQVLSEEVPLADGRTLERDYVPIFKGEEYQGHFWVLRDISPHVEAQGALRRSGDRLRALSEITAGLDPVGEGGLVEGLARVTELLDLDFGLVLRFEGDEYVVEQAHPGDGPLRPDARGSLDELRAGGILAMDDETGIVATTSSPAGGATLVGEVRLATFVGACLGAAGGCSGQVLFGGLQPQDHPWSEPDRELVRLFALWVGKSLDRRRAEEALRTSETRYRDFVENTAALVCIHDLDGIVLEVNRATLEVFGIDDPAQLEGQSLARVLDPRDHERFEEYLKRVACDGRVKGKMTVVAPDGRRRVLSFDNSLRRDGVERPVVRGLGQDITEQYRAEKSLRQRVELEKLLIAISTSFINLPSMDVRRTIERALGDLGRFLDVDRCVVFLLDEERENLERKFSWMRSEEDERTVPSIVSAVEMSVLMQDIARLDPVRLDRIDELPESTPERRWLEQSGVRSLLAVPVSSRGEVLGSIDLSSVRHETRWRDEVVSVLRVIGDIIGSALDRKSSEDALSRAHQDLERTNRELSWNNRRLSLLNEMGDLLQSSTDMDEAHDVIRELVPRVCPGAAGAVYLVEPHGTGLKPVVCWGEGGGGDAPIEADSCWALRRARPYRVEPGTLGPLCKHTGRGGDGGSLCVPLIAQGEALGILHLRDLSGDGTGEWSAGAEQLALNAAEHMALGLGNLALRDRLRMQALRDPLTGLLNRRSLEEELERMVSRSRSDGTPLSLLMLDLDDFKRINDTYGHDVGDRVLTDLADALRGSVREEDVVARLGGDELTIVMAASGLEAAREVAETLRRRVAELRIPARGGWIDDLSVSIGVAALPACATTVEGLFSAADEALYGAKEGGRDRVVGARVVGSAVPDRLALG